MKVLEQIGEYLGKVFARCEQLFVTKLQLQEAVGKLEPVRLRATETLLARGVVYTMDAESKEIVKEVARNGGSLAGSYLESTYEDDSGITERTFVCIESKYMRLENQTQQMEMLFVRTMSGVVYSIYFTLVILPSGMINFGVGHEDPRAFGDYNEAQYVLRIPGTYDMDDCRKSGGITFVTSDTIVVNHLPAGVTSGAGYVLGSASGPVQVITDDVTNKTYTRRYGNVMDESPAVKWTEWVCTEKEQETIVIPVDFTKPLAARTTEVEDFVAPFLADGSIFRKPVFFKAIYKKSYTDESTPVIEKIFPADDLHENTYNPDLEITLHGIFDVDGKYGGEAFMSMLWLDEDGVTYLERKYQSWSFQNFKLAINSDDMYSIADDNLAMSTGGCMWRYLFDYIKKYSKIPPISLYTDKSLSYVPAVTELTWDKTGKTLSGTITIEYRSVIDGVLNLVTESMIMDKFSLNSFHNYFVRTYSAVPLNYGKIVILKMTANEEYSAGSLDAEDVKRLIAILKSGERPVVMVQDVASGDLYDVVSYSIDSKTLYIDYSDWVDGHDSCDGYMYRASASVKSEIMAPVALHIYKVTLPMGDLSSVMLARNIQVVTEYPADLSIYPDGTIFIKQ